MDINNSEYNDKIKNYIRTIINDLIGYYFMVMKDKYIIPTPADIKAYLTEMYIKV